MPKNFTAGRNSASVRNAAGTQKQETAPSRSAAVHAPATLPNNASVSRAGSKQEIRQPTKHPLGATTIALSKYSSSANNPAAAVRLVAARAQLTTRIANTAYQQSLVRATRRFKDFNLSKFAQGGTPRNHIDPKKAGDRTAVRAKQQELIEKQLKDLKDKDTQNIGLTLAIPVERLGEVKKALPGMSETGGKIELQHLLAYLRRHMNGTSFYSRGNPVMTRLTTETKARSQARKIIEKIKTRVAKEQIAAATSTRAPKGRTPKRGLPS
jgi:hypothetical protein